MECGGQGKIGMGYVNSTVKKIFFNCFIILMVCAKGFGLDSGDKAYYVLAVMAIPPWVLCILWTQWSARTFIYSVLVLSLAFVAVITNRKLGVMLSVMAMVAVKDIDRENLMKMIQKWWLCSAGIELLLVLGGIVSDSVISLGYKEFHTMGYAAGNMFHATIAILIMLYLYSRKDKLMLSEVFFILTANFVVYRYSASRGGMLIGAVAALTSYAFKFFAGDEKIKKIMRCTLCIGMMTVVSLSFILPFEYNTEHAQSNLVNAVDSILTGRIRNSQVALLSDPITLFGKATEPAAFLDNAYVYLLIKCGIITTLMICVIYVVAVRSMVRRKNDYGILIIFWFVCYGFIEQMFVNGFLNYSLLIVGHEVMNVVLNRNKIVKSNLL